MKKYIYIYLCIICIIYIHISIHIHRYVYVYISQCIPMNFLKVYPRSSRSLRRWLGLAPGRGRTWPSQRADATASEAGTARRGRTVATSCAPWDWVIYAISRIIFTYRISYGDSTYIYIYIYNIYIYIYTDYCVYIYWLVVWNICYFSILGIIIPTDELIFFRGDRWEISWFGMVHSWCIMG